MTEYGNYQQKLVDKKSNIAEDSDAGACARKVKKMQDRDRRM